MHDTAEEKLGQNIGFCMPGLLHVSRLSGPAHEQFMPSTTWQQHLSLVTFWMQGHDESLEFHIHNTQQSEMMSVSVGLWDAICDCLSNTARYQRSMRVDQRGPGQIEL